MIVNLQRRSTANSSLQALAQILYTVGKTPPSTYCASRGFSSLKLCSCDYRFSLYQKVVIQKTPSRGPRDLVQSFIDPTKRSFKHFPPLYIRHQRHFSSSGLTMAAVKIDGTAIAKAIREKLHTEIQNTQKVNPRYKPCLKIIQGKLQLVISALSLTSAAVGDRSDSCMCIHGSTRIPTKA